MLEQHQTEKTGRYLKASKLSTVSWAILSLTIALSSGSALTAEAVGPAGEKAEGNEGEKTVEVAALDSRPLERITVIGNAENVARIPGAVQRISAEELEKQNYQDIHRILRPVPGVNIQEEDGFGLRPNIGMRGTGIDRSSKITLMEDGVLIAPAPYAAPAAYFFPQAGRFEAVEVSKGPSAIKFGPNTAGGAINLVSTGIPQEYGGRIEGRLGDDDLLQIHATAGGSGEHYGFLFETYQNQSDGFKKLDNGADTGFDIEEYVGKVRFNTSEDAEHYQEIEFKIGYTDQVSNETYLGLTDEDFEATPFRRYAASQKDVFNGEHNQYQARHFAEISDKLDVTTVAYLNHFKRNWFKLNNVVDPLAGKKSIASVLENPTAFAGALAILKGEVTSDDDALIVRNNNREYYSYGVQTVVGASFETGAAEHDLEISVRYHRDKMDRFQWDDKFRMDNGTMVLTKAGVPGTQSNRIDKAEALAVFVQDEIELDRWIIVPGIRFESIDTKRTDFGKADPSRSGTSLKIVDNTADVFIPGLGVVYKATDNVTLIGGVHKGFTSPAPGKTAEEEESVNYEFGLRYSGGGVIFDVIGFYNDYTNLVGTCTASTGGDCVIGDQFDGGEAEVKGVEAKASVDLASALDGRTGLFGSGIALPLSVNYTFTDAEFQTSFKSSFKPWANVTAGDKIPYIPRHQLTASIGVEASTWDALLSLNYVGAVRHRAGQGPIPADARIDSHTVLDLTGHYEVTDSVGLFASIQNLTDATYSVARRPAGL
ncbi:MAG: TonB-dependent receptor family protein, partial [Sphingomonadales bacterium]